MKKVIFCADDFGLDHAVNEAVERAHREGVLDAASLMVGERAAADAITRAKRLPRLGVGLHVVLVEGTPVSPPELIPDLVDAQGKFPSDMLSAGFRFFFRPGVRRQLAREIRAQFEAFRQSGLALDHLNAHKHIHLHPTVAHLILRIGREYGVGSVRVPREPWAPIRAAESRRGSAGFGRRALELWTRQLRTAVVRAGCNSTDQVFGLAWTGAMTEDRLLALIPHLPEGVSEIYLHPASASSPRLAKTMLGYRHADELAALVSPRVRRALNENRIERTSFPALAASAS